KGLDLTRARAERAGLTGDRRWAVVDTDGKRMTARTHPRLLSLTATPDSSGRIRLEAPGRPPPAVAPRMHGDRVLADGSDLDYAVDAGEAGSGWFSELLQAKVRLVWQDDVDRRRISPEHGGLPGEPLTLADAGPLLLVNRASVRRLA